MKNSKIDALNSVFCVAGEMVPANGEDSFYYSGTGTGSIVAVFDGCGGIGSRRYGNYSGKTGAYVASRAVCGGVKAWFEDGRENSEELSEYIRRALSVCSNYADKAGRLMGSLGKSFPTTAAIIRTRADADALRAACYWAGDSRCYMLDSDGLHQLSEDDINGEDALSNISGDGVLTNVISSSAPFTLHKKEIAVKSPCIFITATDGCFGYLKTPMDFEQLLTGTLISSKSILGWRSALDRSIREYTGDDYTLCAAVYGFGSFAELQNSFRARNMFVHKNYTASDADVGAKWNSYKNGYYSYMK